MLDLIAAGRTAPEAAAALGVQIATGRTHLLRLVDKTGAGRQADLVALVAFFAPPLRD